jgi:AcrR family transcriptional regulator
MGFMPLQHLDETARRIVQAASERFMHYGYGKTTMSEIAADCNMSPANLYRYFPSKLDIAEAFVRVLRRDQIEQLNAAAGMAGLTSQQRLRLVLSTKFRLAYERWHNNPRAYELSSVILAERPGFAEEWEAAEREVIAAVIREGAAAGAFGAENPVATAKIVQDAVFRFTSPALFHEGEFEALSAELDAVIDLLLDGLSWRLMRPGAAASGRPAGGTRIIPE